MQALLELEATEQEQESLFDLSATEVQVKLPDEPQILFVPLKPVHHKALKLQNLIATMDRQAARNGAQFNSRNYLDALNAFEAACTIIREEIKNEQLSRSGSVGETRDGGAAPEVGDGNAAGLGPRISADNPLAR